MRIFHAAWPRIHRFSLRIRKTCRIPELIDSGHSGPAKFIQVRIELIKNCFRQAFSLSLSGRARHILFPHPIPRPARSV